MKFADWKKRSDEIALKQRALRAQTDPLEVERMNMDERLERWWAIDHRFCFHAVGDRWSVWDRKHRMQLAHQMSELSSANLRAIAEHVATIERWRAGTLAALPPTDTSPHV